MFFAIFQVLPGDFLIFFVSQFYCHIPGPTRCISHFSHFSLYLAIYPVLPCEFLIFHVYFYYFLPYSKYYSESFSFCTFFNVSRHIASHTMWVFHFPCWSVFLPYSRSYSVYFLFFTFFSVSCHIPGNTLFVSHFPRFSFLAKIKVLQCLFQISRIFHCFSPYFMSYYLNIIFLFVSFLAIFQVVQCLCLIFHIWQFVATI